jgi:acetyltransferase-like isoleucine patch superfamily enzyme
MIHPLAEVHSHNIGESTTIWQFVVILAGARIGEGCNINAHCFIENDVRIGNHVTVKCGVYLWDGITLEDYVQVGPNVTFTNDLYPRAKQPFVCKQTRVRTGASIGANATLIAGITIGAYALIGAGSVVTHDVPDYTLWVGNPARQRGYVCQCGNKLDELLHCMNCNRQYHLNNGIILENG